MAYNNGYMDWVIRENLTSYAVAGVKESPSVELEHARIELMHLRYFRQCLQDNKCFSSQQLEDLCAEKVNVFSEDIKNASLSEVNKLIIIEEKLIAQLLPKEKLHKKLLTKAKNFVVGQSLKKQEEKEL